MKTKDNTFLLLRTMLRASSRLNILKYSDDRKTKRRMIGGIVGEVILGVVLAGLLIAYAFGLGQAGMGEKLPAMTGVVIFTVSFFLTLLKSGGYLFGSRDYNMLVSMPFEIKQVVSSKFLYMYCNSVIWTTALPIAMLVGYGLSGNLTVGKAVMWIVMMPFLPIIPMLIASAISMIVTMIGARSKNKSMTMVGTIVALIVVIPISFSGFFLSNYVEKVGVTGLMTGVSGIVDMIADFLPGAKWFARAVTEQDILSFILMIVVPVILYELFFLIVSKFYRKINSRLSEGTVKKEKKSVDFSLRSIPAAIAMKEWKRMTGSTTYMVNAFLGEILTVIIGIAALIVGPDTLLSIFLHGAPVTMQMVYPAIPFALYFFLGMVATTCISPSIEGKNYWIIKSLPIAPKDDCKGKAMFNLALMLPTGIFATAVVSIMSGAGVIGTLLNIGVIIALSFFSTCFGLLTGMKHRKLNWQNEVEVVKQGAALTLYLFPNLILAFALMIGSFVLTAARGPAFMQIVQIIVILVLFLVSFIFWKKAVKAAEQF
ncbi:MAG: hypothetical protein HUJ73_04595 [Eubacterium sp.]|nr:hypothetical protein [Eubacterium sp.]